MNFRSSRRASRIADGLFDPTALVDVVFILLIFFLITTTVAQSSESMVTINLPQGPVQGEGDPDETLTVLVDSQGDFYLAVGEGQPGRFIARDDLERELTVVFESNPGLTIYLRGDRTADYGHIMDVFLLANSIGFERVQVVVQEEPLPEP